MKMIRYIAIVSGILILASCNDYLERFPLDSPSDASFLRTEAEFDMAVTGAYHPLRWDGGHIKRPFFVMLEVLTDIGWDRNTSPAQELGRGAASVDNSWPSEIWSHFYAAIARCNYILSKAEPLKAVVSQTKYTQSLAEVRFLRAFYYSILNEGFGGVPLVTTQLIPAEALLPRNTKAEVTDFILAELTAIQNDLLPETNTVNKGRASKGAALALKSRVALYNQRWDVAALAADELIKMGNYTLHDSFPDLFKYVGQDSREIILAAQYQKGFATHLLPSTFASRMMNGSANRIPLQVLVDSYECIDGLNIDKSPLFDVNNPFENRDPRLGYTVVLPQTRFVNYIYETHPDSLMTWNVSVEPAQRVQNLEATDPYASFSGYLWRKYTDDLDFPDVSNCDLNVILFRYAEVLLNYAEAKIEANQIDQSVYDAINAIRGRASVQMPSVSPGKSQEELRSIVRKERKYEFAGEGLRLFDIRRWKIGEQAIDGPLLGRVRDAFLTNPPVIDKNGTPHYDNVGNKGDMRVIEIRSFKNDRDNLWPIPRLETEINTKLEQNPNY